jgi:hypothetical protein
MSEANNQSDMVECALASNAASRHGHRNKHLQQTKPDQVTSHQENQENRAKHTSSLS